MKHLMRVSKPHVPASALECPTAQECLSDLFHGDFAGFRACQDLKKSCKT